jgi:LacI family transcriptional regulator
MLALPVGRRPTAMLCANLTAALGANAALRSHAYRVPTDMSLIAFDDHPIEKHLDPPLTVVAMPMAEMGATGTRMLFDAIAGIPVRHVVVDDQPRLVIRASTSALLGAS